MEIQATVLPGKQAKSQPVKPKFKRRTTLPPNDKDQPFVQRRVFGSIRNPNFQEKIIPEKPKWRRPSLKPDQTAVPPKEQANKTVPHPKLVPNKPTTDKLKQPSKHVQTTPFNPKLNPKKLTTEPSAKPTKPLQTPPATKAPQKTAPNSKSVQKTTTKPVHTNAPAPEMFNKTAHNLKLVPNETTALPSPKIEKPVHSATFALEGPDTISPNLKIIQKEPNIVSSLKPSQPVQSPQKANVPQNTSLSPKTIPNEKTTVQLVHTTQPEPEKTTPNPISIQNKPTPNAAQLVQTSAPEQEKNSINPKPVQNKPTTIPSPKPPLPVQTTQPNQDKTTTDPKPVQSKPIIKLSPKPAQQIQTTTPVREVPKKSVSTEKPKKKKKSVSFPEGGMETPGVAKVRLSRTPYYTAKRCSKCRFDRMESSSYWVGLIKLAENVEKHNVSAGLFSLALEAKAEPVRPLKMELNQYLSRHGYISGDPEWRKVTASYGLNVTPNDLVEVLAGENYSVLNQAHEDSVEENDTK